MRKLITLLLFTGIICSGVEYGKGAKEIVDKSNKFNKLDSLKKVKSFHQTNSIKITGQNIKMAVLLYSSGDNVYSKTTMTQGGNTMVLEEKGYDGKVAWSKSLQSGMRELKGDELTLTKQSTLQGMINMFSLYDKVQLSKDETFNKIACKVLLLKKKGSKDTKIYINAKTFETVGTESTVNTQFGDIKITIQITETATHKKGFKYPKKMKMIMGPSIIELTTDSFEIDKKVDESKYKKPGS